MEAVMCAANLFNYDEDKALELDKFFSTYRDRFPMLAVIIDGHYGQTIYDCFENWQVFRVQGISTQARVVCTDSNSALVSCQNYFTIPVKTYYKFRKVLGHTSVGEPQSLTDILAENRLPVLVKLACNPHESVKMSSWIRSAGELGNLLVKATYDEHYMMVNCVDTKELRMNSTSCLMALSQDLTATPVEGFKNKSMDEYRAFLKKLDHQVATSGNVYDKTKGNPAINAYDNRKELPAFLQKVLRDISPEGPGDDDDDDDDSSDGDYEEVIEPPDLPQRLPTSPVSLTHGDTEKDPQSKQKQHKAGWLKEIKSKFKKTMKQETHPDSKLESIQDESKDNTSDQHQKHQQHQRVFRRDDSANKDTTVETTDSPPPVRKKPDVEKAKPNTKGGPPPVPRKPSVEEMEELKRKPADDSAHSEALSLRTQDPGYANKALPNAKIKPMVKASSSIPPIRADRRPQPLPKAESPQETEDDYYDDRPYDDVLQADLEGSEDIYESEEIYTTGGVSSSPHEYIDVKSGNQSLRVKCSRNSQDSTKRPETKQATKQRPEANPDHGNKSVDIDTPTATVLDTTGDTDRFDITKLSMSGVADALKTLRLDKYIDSFAENTVDGVILSSLSVDDLVQELAMKKLEAIRLFRYVKDGHVPR